MGYWKSKVLFRIKKVFGKTSSKDTAADDACKAFNESKDGIDKELEEKKEELQPKVIEIYEASSTAVKMILKKPKESGIRKQSAAVQRFMEELTNIEFPGSKQVFEASTQFGPGSVSGPVIFIFERVFALVDGSGTGTAEGEPAAAAAAAAVKKVVAEDNEVGEAIKQEVEVAAEKPEVAAEKPVLPLKTPSEPVKVEPEKAVG